MSKLQDDLAKYADEFFTKGELEAGKKLLAEVAGLVMLGGAVFTFITLWCPPLSLKAGSATFIMTLARAADAYATANEHDRKQIRAVVSWLKGGFSLGDRLLK